MLKIIVADNCQMIPLGIGSILARHGIAADIEDVASHSDLISVLEARDFDMLVIEPLIYPGSWESMLRNLKALQSNMQVLVLTLIDEVTYGKRALKSGAKGFLMKSCTEREIVNAVTSLSKGRMYVSELLGEKIVEQFNEKEVFYPHDSLSDREFEIFSLLVSGENISSIAEKLTISRKTVSTYKLRIFEKMHIFNMSEAIRYAIVNKIINTKNLL